MKEHDFINIIKKETDNSYIGDDCAYIKDLEIVVTQDNFIEGVHFKKDWATPYQIGYKAAAVNISDVLASGAKPAYLTIGLSLPNVDNNFIKELYRGITAGSYGAKIIGGDITGSDKIFISITAIGKTSKRKISSRKNVKEGYVIIINGEHGLSAQGLLDLQKGLKDTDAIKAHLEPELDPEFSKQIATQINEDYAMMDTSDGLADALFQLAKSSNVTIKAKNISGLFGAEDYKLVAAVPEEFLKNIKNYKIVGNAIKYNGSFLDIDGNKINEHDKIGIYDHFN